MWLIRPSALRARAPVRLASYVRVRVCSDVYVAIYVSIYSYIARICHARACGFKHARACGLALVLHQLKVVNRCQGWNTAHIRSATLSSLFLLCTLDNMEIGMVATYVLQRSMTHGFC